MTASVSNNLLILVADSNDEERQSIANLLLAYGFEVMQAIDGGSAIKVLEEYNVACAILSEYMKPKTAFDVARHMQVKGLKIPTLLISEHQTTDLLLEVTKYEITRVLVRPIDPERMIDTVKRALRMYGYNPAALGRVRDDPSYSHEDLMRRAIALAKQNAYSRMGGPYGAVVTDEAGRILGEGVNSVAARNDPTAHAEVIAIKRATAARGTATDLSGCRLYCSSEPTMLGQALMLTVGISELYYGLTYEDLGASRTADQSVLDEMAKPHAERAIPHKQLCKDEAATMIAAWNKDCV